MVYLLKQFIPRNPDFQQDKTKIPTKQKRSLFEAGHFNHPKLNKKNMKENNKNQYMIQEMNQWLILESRLKSIVNEIAMNRAVSDENKRRLLSDAGLRLNAKLNAQKSEISQRCLLKYQLKIFTNEVAKKRAVASELNQRLLLAAWLRINQAAIVIKQAIKRERLQRSLLDMQIKLRIESEVKTKLNLEKKVAILGEKRRRALLDARLKVHLKHKKRRALAMATIETRRAAITEARKQPKIKSEEQILAKRYGKMSLEDRAYNILVDLGIVEVHLDPNDPSYDNLFDNEIADFFHV